MTAALTASTLVSTLRCVVRRLVEIAVILISAFGLGYLVWGSRIDALTREVGFLGDVVSHQSRQIQNLVASGSQRTAKVIAPAAAADCQPPPNDATAQNDPEKQRCIKDRQRLQNDLESCLFAKARLSRHTTQKAPSRPRLTPRTGTAPIQEFVEHPGQPPAH